MWAQTGKPRVVQEHSAEARGQGEFSLGAGRRESFTGAGPVEGLKYFSEELRLYSMMNWEQVNSSLAPQSRHLEIDCFTF